jgi:hypothetical protein
VRDPFELPPEFNEVPRPSTSFAVLWVRNACLMCIRFVETLVFCASYNEKRDLPREKEINLAVLDAGLNPKVMRTIPQPIELEQHNVNFQRVHQILIKLFRMLHPSPQC